MVSANTIAGTGSIVSVSLSASVLAVVVAGVVLQVKASACGGTVSEWCFLLGGSSSVRGTHFCLWC